MSKKNMGYLFEDGMIVTLEEHDAKLKAEIVEEAAALIRQFTKEWNMENHKRISYIASDELISYLRVHIRDAKGKNPNS